MRGLAALVLAVAALGVAAPVASADFGIAPGGFTASILDSGGSPEARAGAHPDRVQIGFAFNTIGGAADGNLRDMKFELPGVIGNPSAVLACTREQLGGVFADATCPPGSQVGAATLSIEGYGIQSAKIYNAEPSAGAIAELGFSSPVANSIIVTMNPDGHGFTMQMSNALQDAPLISGSVELWGVPADRQTPAGASRQAFLTTPAICAGGPQQATMRVRSWQAPETWLSATAESGPEPTGCESQLFDPQLEIALDSDAVDTPTGLSATISAPRDDDPDGQVAATLREVGLTLPDGVALSPSAANGLASCSPEQAGVGTSAPPACPSSSKLGSAEIRTPLLEEAVAGGLYLGGQLPGTDYRIFLLARTAAVNLKIEGRLHADPDTGRLTTVLSELPEVPFDRIALEFRGGPLAPLVTPLSCGQVTSNAIFSRYGDDSTAQSSQISTIGHGVGGGTCPAALPFAPTFAAGTSLARAGATGPFAVTIGRPDGDQLLDRFSMTLPRGLAARIASAQRCSGAAAAAGSCSSASRVGSVSVEVGAGEAPYRLGGEIFLTGPYRQAPFGFALVFPGRIGPFDMGTIVVRARLRFDAFTGQVTVDSDAFPKIIGGIPLRARSFELDIDRPGFIVNPTSCVATTVDAAIRSTGGNVARSASRFALAGCRRLRFAPKLAVALSGRSELRKSGHPGLRMGIEGTSGGANLNEAEIRLPELLGFDAGAVTAICSREQARDGRCPKASRVGSARGRSPLLSEPLVGEVHIVQPRGNGLPDLWARVRSTGVVLNVRMETAVKRGRTAGRLVEVPDFPFSVFAIKLAGGKNGVIATTRSPCVGGRARRLTAMGELSAHSGAYLRVRTPVRVGCPRSRRGKAVSRSSR